MGLLNNQNFYLKKLNMDTRTILQSILYLNNLVTIMIV